MTNDFVALLKDSSLVSVITVVELTKQTSIFAANIGSWVVPGALCAAMYLVLSLPLARLARRLEKAMAADDARFFDGVQTSRVDRGDRAVVRGVSFAATRGERVALMGASGSGKTTCCAPLRARAIAGRAIDG